MNTSIPVFVAPQFVPRGTAIGPLGRASRCMFRHSLSSKDIVVRWLDLLAGIGNRLSGDDRETSLPRDSLSR
jgi:hypothetical protein